MFHLQEDLLRGFEEEQLSLHTPTPIWKLRDKPPQDWNSPDSGGLNLEYEKTPKADNQQQDR